MLLLGNCQAYVMMHRIARVEEPPLPLDRYLDALVELWTAGAILSNEAGPNGERLR
jgi:hypothetical protein